MSAPRVVISTERRGPPPKKKREVLARCTSFLPSLFAAPSSVGRFFSAQTNRVRWRRRREAAFTFGLLLFSGSAHSCGKQIDRSAEEAQKKRIYFGVCSPPSPRRFPPDAPGDSSLRWDCRRFEMGCRAARSEVYYIGEMERHENASQQK